jgi:hypothetical protein
MKNIKCRFCDELVWYSDGDADVAFNLLHVHVRVKHVTEWRQIQAFLAVCDDKVSSMLTVIGDVGVDVDVASTSSQVGAI